MKRYFIAILAFILCLGIGLTCFQMNTTMQVTANEQSTASISVIGEAESENSPDTAEIRACIENLDSNISVAKDATFTTFEKAQSKLEALGISKNEIVVESFTTYPSYDYNNGRSLTGYYATLNFQFKTKELEKVKDIIDGLTEVGINNIGNIDYSISNQTEVYNNVLLKALENAKSKAVKLLGKEELTLSSLDEQHVYYSTNLFRSYSQGIENQDMVGKVLIKAKVVAKFC